MGIASYAVMDTTIMKSINFEFLHDKWPDLSGLGGFAEQYANPDPPSALVKLRAFAESMSHYIYQELDLSKPDFQPSLYELLKDEAFQNSIPSAVADKLHALRINGNKAAHGHTPSSEDAHWLLRETFDLAKWLFITFGDGEIGTCPTYNEPPYADSGIERGAARAAQEKKAILKKMWAQEAQLQALLAQLEAERSKTSGSERKVDVLEAHVKAGHEAADILKLDEAATRKRLIDSMVIGAGWDVGADGENTEEVTQEEEVEHQPTDTGIGYADYVLWDDNGKPLAVIEAKKTSKDAEQGRTQARLYADGLERMHLQRPIIFYTNGFDVYMWDDAGGYPPRLLFGFYSKDSLRYLVGFQRKEKITLDQAPTKQEVVDRLYQLEAVRRVCERFMEKRRKSLLVQATGTGKTRVAIALADVLIRARWVKRVLFLCDRKELRKQAKNAFSDFLNEPLTIVTARTAGVRDKRIYLATYPAMNKIFQTFDVGFFDLIIADESHRSIYNRYRDLFRYFDCLQLGLTATPVDFISRNTFHLFDCKDKDPTVYYSLDQAVEERYLVPYEVFTHTTRFLREGIKYRDLTEAQIRQLEEGGEDPECFDYENHQVDKQIFNRETNRAIIRNLMENGIKDRTGQWPGKSIVFARNHAHAILLSEVFDELYPQYGGKFCQVIDNYDPRAEQLIDDFKGIGNNKELTIAISVDMLDTGIDVPEIVNLVFAKPIRSLVKFEQMIGRGTRLCMDLFGAGKDKKRFRIFDHWGNFEYFDKKYKKAEPSQSKPLMQLVFEARIDLADATLRKSQPDAFDQIVKLIEQDLASLPEGSIAVKEKWREKRTVSRPETLRQFAPSTVLILRSQMAPLMQWMDIRGQIDAYRFDLLVANLQSELFKDSSRFHDFKDQLRNRISELQMHLNPVRAKAEIIKEVQGSEFWYSVTFDDLERIRKELRGIMQYKGGIVYPIPSHKYIDIHDGGVELARRSTRHPQMDMLLYKKRVEEALLELFDENPTLQKIRAGRPVTESDLYALTSLVLTRHPDVDLNVLKEFYTDTAAPLDHIIRTIIGMDPEAVRERFASFVNDHPGMNANQIQFLNLLQNHIRRNGSIEIERLYEPPFTKLHTDGLDGMFSDETLIDELIPIIDSFSQRINTDLHRDPR